MPEGLPLVLGKRSLRDVVGVSFDPKMTPLTPPTRFVPLADQLTMPYNSAPALPKIAITMGDPAGVGPEICLRALASEEIAAICQPIVFGDAGVLAAVARKLEIPFSAPVVSEQDWHLLAHAASPGRTRWCATSRERPCANSFTPGRINAITGRASHHYVDRAIDAALARRSRCHHHRSDQ